MTGPHVWGEEPLFPVRRALPYPSRERWDGYLLRATERTCTTIERQLRAERVAAAIPVYRAEEEGARPTRPLLVPVAALVPVPPRWVERARWFLIGFIGAALLVALWVGTGGVH